MHPLNQSVENYTELVKTFFPANKRQNKKEPHLITQSRWINQHLETYEALEAQ